MNSPRLFCSLPSFAALALLLSFVPATVMAAPPDAPTDLTFTALAYNLIQLDWKDNSTGEAGFEIQYRIGTTGDFLHLGKTPADEPTASLNGTSGNTTYQFQIRAIGSGNPVEYSSFAGPVTVLTPYRVTSSDFRGAVLGQPFTFNLVSVNPASVTGYSVSALPPGLTLDPATGVITGTPSELGKTTGNVIITHSNGNPGLGRLTIRVFKPQPSLAAPVVATPPASIELLLGAPPATVSLESSFTDPDVSKAARLVTDLGNLDFAFYPESAPKTVENFLGYVSRGDFANTMFHRSVKNFIVQGGAFRADTTASAVATQASVVNEPEITNTRGTVAMAKLGGEPDSATNQFFINLSNNGANLDSQNEGFTVFARVAGNGMAVADAIAALPLKSYAAVNGALTDTPVRADPPPAVYDSSLLVRISSATSLDPLSFTAVSGAPAIVDCAVNGRNLILTPVSIGETLITVTAKDLDEQTVQTIIPVKVNETDTFSAWATRQNFPSSAAAEAGADPDGDGLANLVEFALGFGPMESNAAGGPILSPGGGGGSPALSFNLRQNITGITVALQTAADPAGTWTDQWKSTDGFTHPWITGTAVTGDAVTITAKNPAPSGPREFMRLKVSQ
ncbi:MAG: hypothetical protein EOP86_04130 [Verrucomicrobiaceae bacterium]|nr:MAG: hypothetical protein EOP86_04130 [Verrucomicrobiaceae bacterium]